MTLDYCRRACERTNLVIPTELVNYIHGRLTSARNVNMAEIEGILVRQFQSPYVRGQLNAS